MEYMTVREAAKKWEVSVRLIQRLCAEGRIDGASKSGNAWVIPAGTVKPQDPRRKKEETVYGNPVFPNLASDEYGICAGKVSGIYPQDEKGTEKGYCSCRISLFQRTSQ